MTPFLTEDFMLRTEWAKRLYHGAAERMPVFDYHCHLNPREIAENKRFSDIGELFLNLDEFGEVHTIDGNEVTVIVAPDEKIELAGGYMLGLSQSHIKIHAKSSSLPTRKASGAQVNFDGTEYTVAVWNEHMGMSEIELTVPGVY